MVSLFSCSDKCMLVILESRWEESCESVLHCMCHMDGHEICLPNLFSEGGGAQSQPKVNQLPRRGREMSEHRTKLAE